MHENFFFHFFKKAFFVNGLKNSKKWKYQPRKLQKVQKTQELLVCKRQGKDYYGYIKGLSIDGSSYF